MEYFSFLLGCSKNSHGENALIFRLTNRRKSLNSPFLFQGFDGTMQVSVIEVEPQNVAELTNKLNGRQSGSFGASEDPRSDAFMDSFGEFHAPSPFGPVPPQMREISENSIVPPQSANGRGRGGWPEPSEFSGFEM
jgi:hypothetical protein